VADSRIVHLTDESFDDAVAEGVVLVDMWAPWCSPCLVQGPIVEKVAKTIGDKARVAKLNVDDGLGAANRLGIQAIPTLILLKDGVEVERFVGLQSEGTLVSAIEKALKA
jgi:thioredoxin 1